VEGIIWDERRFMVMVRNIQITVRAFPILFFVIFVFSLIGVCEAGQPKLDVVAVEETLKAWFTKNPFVKMHGIHKNNDTSATAYFVIHRKGNEKDARAKIIYFIDKGWFIIQVEYGYGPYLKGWYDVFEKVERKK